MHVTLINGVQICASALKTRKEKIKASNLTI